MNTMPVFAALIVILLGTGTPVPRVERAGPSTLVEAGKEKLLFDCGREATLRLIQAHVAIPDITAVFFTHLHSDHVVGFPDFLLTGWTALQRRTRPVRVFGPAGTKEMMANVEKAYAEDVRIRIADEKLPPEGVQVDAVDVTPGVVYEHDGVKVTAFDVDHGPMIKPSFGYRIEYGGHAVVLSGDTRFSESLIRNAAGADVIVHEVMISDPKVVEPSDRFRRIVAHHTSPAEAGTVFARVKPKLAVYSHVGSIGQFNDEDIVRQTRTHYDGRVVVGSDLMTIEIGDRVTVKKR
ncbi:MAG TPA: MBL fold metallo-hydrolase [Thermoanaerobaculia bacterium]|nr:MBL fold metallo-hydrolase [Thermoanaerobaculia bacterium]